MGKYKKARGRANAILDQQYQLDLDNWVNNVAQEEEVRTLKDKQALEDYEFRSGVKEAQEEAQKEASRGAQEG